MKRTKLPEDLNTIQSAIREVLGNGDVSVFLSRSKKRINTQKYVIVFQYANKQLLKRLPARSYLMLSYLYTICDIGNLIPVSMESISEDLGQKKRNVYAAMQQLKSCNLVLKIEGAYHISPQIAWCGSLQQWKRTIESLSESEKVKIPIDRQAVKINRLKNEVIPFDRLQQKISNA